MSLTITIPGAVNVTTGSFAPAVLTIGVGVPGAQGPQGPAGPGVPAGGTAGQFLTKIDGTNYNTDWTTLNLSAYLTKAGNLSGLTDLFAARDNLQLGALYTPTFAGVTAQGSGSNVANLTPTSLTLTQTGYGYFTIQPSQGIRFPDTSVQTTAFPTGSNVPTGGTTGQSLVKSSNSNYAMTWSTVAGQPTSGTVGQVLMKNSGADYDSSWQTLIPGDRYVTSSTTSNTIGNGAKTFTVGTGLSYSSQQDVVISYDAANHMHAVVTSYDSGTGVLVVDVRSHTGSGTYTSWTVNVGGTTPLQTVEWGEILGTLGDQTDLATALNAKLETSTAASTYAALAGATFTGEVVTPASTTSNAGLTITPGVAPTTPVNGELWATTTDLQVRLNGVTETVAEQSWVTANFYPLTGNPSGFLTSASLSGYALLSGATFTGLVGTPASTTTTAGLNIPHGTAPSAPVNGDVWSTTGGLFWRQNGSTQQAVEIGSTQTISGNKTFSNANLSLGTSTAAGTINIGTGATISGATKTINIGTSGVSGSTTNITLGPVSGGAATITLQNNTTVGGTLTVNGASLSLGTSTAAGTIGIGTGATVSGSTRTINIGTASAAGSTNAIVIGGGSGTSTTTLQGTTNGVTVAADTNSTALATTAFVVGQAGSATPLVDGTAAVGTSLRYARQDHVHPTDTSRAALASPTFTGTPAAPTAAVDTNTTQLATTAFVVGQAGSATPLVNGTAAVGTSLRYARQDHVHPTDTTRAPLASPAFTGTPTAPTATAGTNTTQIATTAFVTAAVPTFATNTQARVGSSTTLGINPNNLQAAIMSPNWMPVPRVGFTGTISGTGAEIHLGSIATRYQLPSTGASGHAYARNFGFSQVDQLWNMWGGNNQINVNFAKRIWLSGRAWFNLPDQANYVGRISFGKTEASGVGDLALAGIGLKYTGGTGNFVQLMVHNGTTLTTVNSSFDPTDVPFDWDIVSDGAGNVTLFINGSSVATTSAGPSGLASSTQCLYQEEIVLTSTSLNSFTRFYCARGAIYVQP